MRWPRGKVGAYSSTTMETSTMAVDSCTMIAVAMRSTGAVGHLRTSAQNLRHFRSTATPNRVPAPCSAGIARRLAWRRSTASRPRTTTLQRSIAGRLAGRKVSHFCTAPRSTAVTRTLSGCLMYDRVEWLVLNFGLLLCTSGRAPLPSPKMAKTVGPSCLNFLNFEGCVIQLHSEPHFVTIVE
jgi:hypothetical protein